MWKKELALVALFLAAVIDVGSAQALNYTSRRDWKPPQGWDKQFPYYIAGFDKGGRPLLIFEYGKFDIRSKMSEGPAEAANMEAYLEQLGQNFVSLGREFEADGGYSMVVDFEGFNYLTLAHPPTTLVLLRASRYAPEWGRLVHTGVGINANYATEQLLGFLGPLLSNVLSKSEVLGTNKERWIPKLLSEFPKSQLPPWYGGNEDWKPLQVLGQGVPIDFGKIKGEKVKFDSGEGAGYV